MSKMRYWLLVTGVIAWGSLANAQTYFKWTDDKGVVHFSDAPPADSKGVEERHLPAPPAVAPPKEVAVGRASEASANEGAPTDQPPTGPARVIVTSRQAPHTGPSAVHVIGEVKNVGGADARRVAVTISAVDVTQGTPCLKEEASVEPSTLHPGDKGNFDVDVDSPCLFGDPNVDVAPVWD
jgi:uncharacterized protein DUF4124